MPTNAIRTALVTVNYPEHHFNTLYQTLQPAKVLKVDGRDKAAISEALKEADVAILGGDLDDQILREGENLKWIHCDHAGINNSARPEVFERGILLSGSAGRSGPVLAEHAFFLLLSLIYDARGICALQDKHVWDGAHYRQSRGLYSKTMGIVGMGYTGREIALRAKAFGMKVLGYSRTGAEIPPGVDRMYYGDGRDSMDELLAQSDVIVLSIRLSDKTYHMIDARTLSLMKKSALLINMARGSVVDEAALANALQDGTIAGAGSDVFETEPLLTSSPLWDLPNMIITPHCTPEMPDMIGNCAQIICENIRRYRAGEPLMNQAKPEDVYTHHRI